MRRISKFLTLEERDQLKDGVGSQFINSVKENLKPNTNGFVNGALNTSTKKEYDLLIQNLTACYSVIEGVDNPNFLEDDKSSSKSVKFFNAVKNINMACKPGELIIVVGSVGCGKSSLLQSILSELKIKEGKIDLNGSLSYAAQEPWTFRYLFHLITNYN